MGIHGGTGTGEGWHSNSSLTMDELADIVSTYDEIHADAIKELNNRLDTFRDKL